MFKIPVNSLPTMPSITFSVAGIQHQLSLLDTNKASEPDNIHPYMGPDFGKTIQIAHQSKSNLHHQWIVTLPYY